MTESYPKYGASAWWQFADETISRPFVVTHRCMTESHFRQFAQTLVGPQVVDQPAPTLILGMITPVWGTR